MKNVLNLKAAMAVLTLTLSLVGYIVGTPAYDPTGTWNIEIDLPDRTAEGIIVISKNDKGEYEVSMEDPSEGETVELEEVSFDEEEMILTGEADADGITLEIKLEFEGDTIEGKVSAEGMEMKLSGERETE